MTLFHSNQITVLRYPNGSYVAGRWVDGSPVPLIITGSVQPGSGDRVLTNIEGKRFSGNMNMYVDVPLRCYDPIRKTRGDMYKDSYGILWEIVEAKDCQCGIIPHYEYTLVRSSELI